MIILGHAPQEQVIVLMTSDEFLAVTGLKTVPNVLHNKPNFLFQRVLGLSSIWKRLFDLSVTLPALAAEIKNIVYPTPIELRQEEPGEDQNHYD